MKFRYLFLLFLFLPTLVFAQSPFLSDEYLRGKIVSLEDGPVEEVFGGSIKYDLISVKLLSGGEAGSTVLIKAQDFSGGDAEKKLGQGKMIILRKVDLGEGVFEYEIDDRYRLPALAWIFILFAALAIFFGGVRSVGALAGLGISIAILMLYVVPRILAGESPFWITLSGAFLIAICTMFLAHGFNKKTGVSLLSTLITLLVATVLAEGFIRGAYLFGFGSDGVFFLQAVGATAISFRGLLLGGFIIGMLGVLDDVTTAQVATVYELKRANKSFSAKELYTRGLAVGKEHISSLVNTLVLAYAGASLPLFLLFTLEETEPLWVIINSEFVAEEVVRMLIGSVALILAVPIATYLAAQFFSRRSLD